MSDRILFIEDEPVLRETCTFALLEADFQVIEVSNCLEAILELDNLCPDLVILDEDLPVVDGWETCHLLHSAFGLPVIILGDNYSEEIWDRMLQMGADFYLRMPFSQLELVSRTRAILQRYKKKEKLSQL
ncbi:response regulator transcription factor [Chloroflexota bacterium]